MYSKTAMRRVPQLPRDLPERLVGRAAPVLCEGCNDSFNVFSEVQPGRYGIEQFHTKGCPAESAIATR